MKTFTNFSILSLALALGVSAEDQWTNPDGGNTHLDFGDTKIAFGYVTPWDAMNHIKDECVSTGCNSENKIEISSGVVSDGSLVSAKITLSVEGSFNDAGEDGNIDQLIEIVKAAYGASDYEYQKGVQYTTGNGCKYATGTPCDRK